MLRLKKAALTAGFSEANSDLVTNFGQLIARQQIADDTVTLQVSSYFEGRALAASKDVYGVGTYFVQSDFVQFATKQSIELFELMIEYSLVTANKASDIDTILSFTDIQYEALRIILQNSLLASGQIAAAQLYTTKTKLFELALNHNHNTASALSTTDPTIEVMRVSSHKWYKQLEAKANEVMTSDSSTSTPIHIAVLGQPKNSKEGLAKLNNDIERESIVDSLNSLYAQKSPFLASSCAIDNKGTTALLEMLLIDSSNTNKGGKGFACLNLVARITKGVASSTKTLNANNKEECENLFELESQSKSLKRYDLGRILQDDDGTDLLGIIKAEVCAQFDI